MVVGDQRRDAKLVCARHAFDAGDAVVDGHDQVGLHLCREVDEFRRQAVAELEAVRHQVLHLRAERAQRPDADRAGRGPVAVVVRDDQDPLPAFDRVGQELRGLRRVQQLVGREQPRRIRLELGGRADLARGIDAGEHRVHAAADQCEAVGFGVGAGEDGHISSAVSTNRAEILNAITRRL